MAHQIEVSSGIGRIGRLLLTLSLLVTFGTTGCDDREKAKSEAAEVPAPTLEGELARLTAVEEVRDAQSAAFSAGVRAQLSEEREIEGGETEFAKEGRPVTFVFSANNRGEREDCGCKSNPLGGLGRRHTLIDLAGSGGDEAAKWWGEPSAPAEALFVADAGDLFYKSSTLDRSSDWEKQAAKIDARTVARSIALSPPDAYAVSELDLVFGIDELQELIELSGMKALSANLQNEEGERIFDASTVVERAGLKVAYIGVTKPDSRMPDYYSSRGLKSAPIVEAVATAANELEGDLDLVVLLSNAGVPATEAAIRALKERGTSIDLALVSGSNRLTKSPIWAEGTPIVEPLSRGKWLGRVDLRLRGDDVVYRDAGRSSAQLERAYRRAWGSAMAANKRWLTEEKRLVQAKIAARDAAGAAGAAGAASDAGGTTTADREKKRDVPNVTFVERRAETMERQAKIAWEELLEQVAAMKAAEASSDAVEGDDEIAVRTAQVKLDIPEEPRVRRLIDRAEKGKPQPPERKKRKVVPPRPGGHDH